MKDCISRIHDRRCPKRDRNGSLTESTIGAHHMLKA